MEVISEDSINRWIVPHLNFGKRGPGLKVKCSALVSAILYRLKTGCQWRQLPVKQFFDDQLISWQGVYHHFRKWAADGSLRKVWIALLKQWRRLLDLSCVQLDGSQTICKNGGECIGYQARKAAKICNCLFLADNTGLLLACSEPVSGAHHDLYQIERLFRDMCQLLHEAGIETEGLFLNADAGFDSRQFRSLSSELKIEANIDFNPGNGLIQDDYVYFDEELYKARNVIEQANACLDGFKALLIRFETKAKHWIALHLLAFSLLFIRKICKHLKL